MSAGRPSWFLRASVRLLRATTIFDRLYSRFDRVRSRAVLRSVGLPFYETYNAAAYGADRSYRPGAPQFRRTLFRWEELLFRDHLPPAPARLLIGGCGGGREALALADRGYSVVGFDPAALLIADIRSAGHPGVEAFVGRYETLPIVHLTGGGAVDLSGRALFGAAILGWGSFSHLLTDQDRIDALKKVSTLTRGPIVVSYLPAPDGTIEPRPPTFSVRLGYYRELMGAEIRTFAASAGLDLVVLNEHENWPHAVLRRRA